MAAETGPFSRRPFCGKQCPDIRSREAQLTSLNFPTHFFIQLILAQGVLILLLIFIATKQPRYAAYLFASATAVSVVALATDVTDVGLLLGETLPFYAMIFILAWNGALAARGKDLSSTAGCRRLASDSSLKPLD